MNVNGRKRKLRDRDEKKTEEERETERGRKRDRIIGEKQRRKEKESRGNERGVWRCTVVFREGGLCRGVHHGPLAWLMDGAGELRGRLGLLHLRSFLFSHLVALLLGRPETRWPPHTYQFQMHSGTHVYHLTDDFLLLLFKTE